MARRALSVSIAVACLFVWPAPGASARPVALQRGPAIADEPPAALKQLGDIASALFEAARAADWQEASIQLRAMDEATHSLPMRLPDSDADAQLRSRITAVHRNVNERRVVASMEHANAITRLVAEISGRFQNSVPLEISMLSYYGRQLELGAVSRRPAVWKKATTDLRTTWNSIEPKVLQRGDTADAKQLTDIVAQLDGDRRPADVASTAHAELATAAKLRQMFESGH